MGGIKSTLIIGHVKNEVSIWSIKSKGLQQVKASKPHNMCLLSSPIRFKQPVQIISHQPPRFIVVSFFSKKRGNKRKPN